MLLSVWSNLIYDLELVCAFLSSLLSYACLSNDISGHSPRLRYSYWKLVPLSNFIPPDGVCSGKVCSSGTSCVWMSALQKLSSELFLMFSSPSWNSSVNGLTFISSCSFLFDGLSAVVENPCCYFHNFEFDRSGFESGVSHRSFLVGSCPSIVNPRGVFRSIYLQYYTI